MLQWMMTMQRETVYCLVYRYVIFKTIFLELVFLTQDLTL